MHTRIKLMISVLQYAKIFFFFYYEIKIRIFIEIIMIMLMVHPKHVSNLTFY